MKTVSATHWKALISPRHRRGLTLIETLVTLALTGFIITGVTLSVRQFWHYRQLAQQNSRAANLRRGTAEDIVMDLRAARQPLKRREAPDSINKTALPLTGAEDDGIRERVLDLTESKLNLEQALGQHPVCFLGERQWLAVLVRGSSFRFPDAEPAESGLSHVVWWDGSLIRPALSLNARRQITVTLGSDDIRPGLYRASLPFRSFGSAGAASGISIHNVSENVRRISFRYFSGDGWASRWNSEEQQRLPQAIECLLTGSSGSDTFIVRLPAAGT